MKKLLELLGIILITSNAVGTLVANKPTNNKTKIKNSLETLTRPKRQAPKGGKGKNKNIKQSSTSKSQNVQPSTSKTDNQIEFIKKEITWNEKYKDSVETMLEKLRKENCLSWLRSLNMGGLISTSLDSPKTAWYTD